MKPKPPFAKAIDAFSPPHPTPVGITGCDEAEMFKKVVNIENGECLHNE